VVALSWKNGLITTKVEALYGRSTIWKPELCLLLLYIYIVVLWYVWPTKTTLIFSVDDLRLWIEKNDQSSSFETNNLLKNISSTSMKYPTTWSQWTKKISLSHHNYEIHMLSYHGRLLVKFFALSCSSNKKKIITWFKVKQVNPPEKNIAIISMEWGSPCCPAIKAVFIHHKCDIQSHSL